MTVTYSVENLADYRDDIKPLLDVHWREVAVNADIPLDPDWSFYEQAEKLGILKTYTARDDGRLVGYALYFFRPTHHHYRSIGFAVSDIVNVAPEYRRAGVGNGLLEFAEADLTKCGAAFVMMNAKHEHPSLGRLLLSRNYRHSEDGFTKRLI